MSQGHGHDIERKPNKGHDITLSSQTRNHLNKLRKAFEEGKLFEGDSAHLSKDKDIRQLLSDGLRAFGDDFKNHIGADPEEKGELKGVVVRNLMGQIFTYEYGGWTYWGAYNYVNDYCVYLGRSRGGEYIYP
jgi:hypothetical protein